MARLWLTYREGLRLVGAPVADVDLQSTVPRIDIAPWRLFTTEAPSECALAEVEGRSARKRVLVEVRETDRGELCGLTSGFYESPYSYTECRRRLNLLSAA